MSKYCPDCGAAEDYRTHDCSAPHVPDVDGNPIRVGQLVGHVGDGDGWLDWAERIFYAGQHCGFGCVSLRGGAHKRATNLRVVTDTFRPPEPDTRDVTLRVVLRIDPGLSDDYAIGVVYEGIHEEIVTVEVVDDGEDDL